MPLRLDQNGYNSVFSNFVEFARHNMNAGDEKAVAEAKWQTPLGGRKVVAVTNSLTDAVHNWTRGMDEWIANDRTRALFKAAISDMFGGEDHIPESVKKAMLLSDYGEGKPLTARRIMAVKDAIDLEGSAKARAAREAVVSRHQQAEPGSDEAKLVGIGGRFTANETEFNKGLALFGSLGGMATGLSFEQKSRIGKNFAALGVSNAKINEAMYRMALEDVAYNGEADLNDGGALFTPANNSALRLALLEYTDTAFKTIASLPPARRAELARILDRFMVESQTQDRPGDRAVVQDDFVRRLAVHIDQLAKLDKAGKLDALALVKICYPEVQKPSRFDLGNAIFADVAKLKFNRDFKAQVEQNRYYYFEDETYIDAMQDVAEKLQARLGTDFVPEDIDLAKLVRGRDLANHIDGLVDEAIAQNRKVDVKQFSKVVADRMFARVVEQRIGDVMEEMAQNKGVVIKPGSTMSAQLLLRQPELYEGFRSAQTSGEANAALAAIRGAMEAAVERERDLQDLMDAAVDQTATLIADKLGITREEAKANVKFEDRLRMKLFAVTNSIQSGQQPDCREPGFNPKPLFDDIVQKVAGEYIAKFDEIDALEGVSDEMKSVWKGDIGAEPKPSEYDMAKIVRLAAKLDASGLSGKLSDDNATDADKIAEIKRFCEHVDAAGRETFDDWGEMGTDEKNAHAMMALRQTMAKTPALKPLLAGILSKEDNVMDRTLPEVAGRGYVIGQLRNLAQNP